MQNKHPILNMTHPRAKIWKEQASDEDFMQYLYTLANIYAGRKHNEEQKDNGKLDMLRLFTDYKKWLNDNAKT